jgi:hypothetical protein
LQTAEQQLVGEDAAAFDLSKQSLKSWGIFGVLLTSVLAAMYVVSTKSPPAVPLAKFNCVQRTASHYDV